MCPASEPDRLRRVADRAGLLLKASPAGPLLSPEDLAAVKARGLAWAVQVSERYDDYAGVHPALHSLREAAKVRPWPMDPSREDRSPARRPDRPRVGSADGGPRDL